jgi:hypothetical protein
LAEKVNANKVLMGNSKGKYHLEDLGVDGKILDKYILRWEDEDRLDLVQDRD